MLIKDTSFNMSRNIQKKKTNMSRNIKIKSKDVKVVRDAQIEDEVDELMEARNIRTATLKRSCLISIYASCVEQGIKLLRSMSLVDPIKLIVIY